MGFRKKDAELASQFNKNKLKFDESTYYFSSKKKEKDFTESQFRDEEELERYKKYRLEWHRRTDEMDSGDVPLAVICELVSTCNLKCEMCYTMTPEFQDSVVGAQRVLPWDVVVGIIDECAEIGVCSLLFSWRGESTLYRSKGADGVWHDFGDVLQYARDKNILEVTSLTNGRSLNDGLIEKIVKAEPNWISFSIDGLEEEYNKIRKPLAEEKAESSFGIVLDNLNKMVALRDELGLKRPQMRSNTIYPAIAKDPEKYRKFMEDVGIGMVTVNEILDFRGDELPEELIMDNWFCSYPFQRLVVSANGIILPCPGAHNEEDELVIGRYPGSSEKTVIVDGVKKVVSYPEVTLKDAWNSEKIERVRRLHRENRRKEIDTCKYCRHGAKKHDVTWIPEDWNMEKMEWEGVTWRE